MRVQLHAVFGISTVRRSNRQVTGSSNNPTASGVALFSARGWHPWGRSKWLNQSGRSDSFAAVWVPERQAVNLYQIRALRWLFPRLFTKVGMRRVLGRPIADFGDYAECVAGLNGLEIGGPSQIFRNGGLIPLYELAGSIDNCNFTSELWGDLTTGKTFRFSSAKPPGTQYIVDATSLPSELDGHYDFVLSSHMLEHTANPLQALHAWRRVLRPSGSLLLVLPDKYWTFDHLRPTTEMQHLIDDFEAARGEDDLTHMSEILRLYDLSRCPPVTRDQLEKAVQRNAEHRYLHHHVFDAGLVRQILEYCGFAVKNGAGRRRITLAQIRHERADIGIGQGGMMVGRRDLLRLGQ